MADIDITPPNICDSMEVPPLPILPDGLSLSFPIPGIGHIFSARLCCKIIQLPFDLTPPIPFTIPLHSTTIVAINLVLGKINTYLRKLPLKCPRE